MPNSQGVAADVDGPERIIHPTPPAPRPIAHTDVHRRLALLEARLAAVCDWINNHDTPKETP